MGYSKSTISMDNEIKITISVEKKRNDGHSLLGTTAYSFNGAREALKQLELELLVEDDHDCHSGIEDGCDCDIIK